MDLTKERRMTTIKVVNTGAYGERRQITLALDPRTRVALIEALLDHHELDIG